MTTIVLVHGAWLGSWVWRKIVPPLREKCHRVEAVTLTGMGDRSHLASPDQGIETSIEDVMNLIEFQDLKDVVLVGHSFAGKVIAAVQDRMPDKIRTLLFLDAVRPENKRSPQGGMEHWPEKSREQILEVCRKEGEGWKFPLTDEIMSEIGDDIKGDDRQWFLSKVRPIPIKIFGGSVTLSENYDRCNKAYVVCTRGGDDVDSTLRSVKDSPHTVIDSGHWPMVTKPHEVIEALTNLPEQF